MSFSYLLLTTVNINGNEENIKSVNEEWREE